MQGRNCPNCGAPLEVEKNKCAYCGTSYFDLSAINIDNSEPFWLKFRTNYGGKSVTCTMLVRAEPNLTMTVENETVSAVCGNYYREVQTSREVQLEMTFRSVQRKYLSDHFAYFQIDED